LLSFVIAISVTFPLFLLARELRVGVAPERSGEASTQPRG
jgi:hypothetical protein